MHNLQETITATFNKNIEYFQKEQPAIFEKLSALDNAVTNKHYQDKYELVYENDSFDVLEISTGKYLYSHESFTHTLTSAQNVNTLTDNYTFEGFSRTPLQEEDHMGFQVKPELLHTHYLAPLINYMKNDYTQAKSLKHLPKFIFFGVGLGLHIESIHKKISSDIYFIVEEDLELFRLSLFTCNYKELAQDATLIFSVFEEQNEFIRSCTTFLDTKSYYNHYLKFFHLLSHNENKIEQFSFTLTSQPHLRFMFTDSLLQYTQALKYVTHEYNFLTQGVSLEAHKEQGLPYLLIASGPSLQNNIQWLKENQDKFLIVAVSSSLGYLEQEKVTPNIILNIDPFEWGLLSFNRLSSLDFIKDSICIFGASTPQSIISLISKEKLFLFETDTQYREKSLKLTAPCIGSMALQFLLTLKVKNIYLLGLDLAIDTTTGQTHAGEHQSKKTLTDTQEDEQSPIKYNETLFNVTGNLTPLVQTTAGYYTSIYTIEYYMNTLLQKYQVVYNLSNGAKFSNTHIIQEPNKLQVTTLNENSFQNLVHFFNTHSKKTATREDFNILNEKQMHAEGTLITLQTLHQKEYRSIENLIEDIYSNIITNTQKYELSIVIEDFMHYIGSYIYDYCQDNKQNKEVLKNLSMLLLKQIEKLTLYYIDTLKEALHAKS